MNRRTMVWLGALGAVGVGWSAYVRHASGSFPSDHTPDGAYLRIVLAVSEDRPRDCFAYLETQAQWASFTIRDYRSRAAALIAEHYPEPERAQLLAEHAVEAGASDGPDAWSAMARRRGWLDVLRRDLSGVGRVEVLGERATVETARGTRLAFRKRDNGIWGMTMFTAELLAEAEKAARDFEVVERAAQDYARRNQASAAPRP